MGHYLFSWFFILFILGLASLLFYAWKRTIKDNRLDSLNTQTLTWVLIGLGVLTPFFRILDRSAWTNDLIGFIDQGLQSIVIAVFFVMLPFLIHDIVQWSLRRYRSVRRPPFDDTLTKAKYALLFQEHNASHLAETVFSNRILTIGAVFFSICVSWVGIKNAIRPPVIHRHSIKAAAPNMEGLKVVLVTDLHLSLFHSESTVESLLRIVKDEKPDLILLGGDIIDRSNSKLRYGLEHLSDLSAPLGVYAVLGNHEVSSLSEDIIEKLESMGVGLLRNNSVRIVLPALSPTENADNGLLPALCLAGTRDEWEKYTCTTCGPSVSESLGGCLESDQRILVTHEPVTYLNWIEENTDNDASLFEKKKKKSAFPASLKPHLVLAGHTHGGQIAPLSWMMSLFDPHVSSGLYKVSNSDLIVSSGAGRSGPYLRVGTKNSVELIQFVQ